jgi:hypothetical protein
MSLIIAADNLNFLNPAVSQALATLQPQPLQELARRCEQAGAGLAMALVAVLQPGLMESVRVINQLI